MQYCSNYKYLLKKNITTLDQGESNKHLPQNNNKGYSDKIIIHFDSINIRILEYMTIDADTKSTEIAKKIGIPLSTVQRRRAQIEKSGIVKKTFEIDTKKIGLRSSDMLIKVTKGQIENVATEIFKQHSKSILEMSLRIGQLDFNLVAKVVYKDSDEIYEIIKTVNTIDNVESVQWSEIVKILIRKENGLIENLAELSK